MDSEGRGLAMIRRVVIRNYRVFRDFSLELSGGLNTLVGKNDTGKSTLIEAIALALTGRLNGRPLAQELSPYLINSQATKDYIGRLRAGEGAVPTPPELMVEIFLEDYDQAEILRGTNNSTGEDACGIRIQASISPDFHEEYQNFVANPDAVHFAPTEYYRVEWLGFSGNGVTARSSPAAACVIDASTTQLYAGIDHHLQQIVRTHLATKDRVELTREYRSLREEFALKETIGAVNRRLQAADEGLTDRALSLAFDISQRSTWESGLALHLDDVPFQLLGKGEQTAIKTLLAIGQKAEDPCVVLIEEPETHLSFTALRRLIARVEAQCAGRQVIVATHSAYVLNKLGLESLILLGGGQATRITEVPASTQHYFKTLAGFDTLRLVLSEAAILVEGPSDELIVQRAYRDQRGHLPIEDGIDVISVGLSHKRFLDLAVRLRRRVAVVTDNDGRSWEQVQNRFADYLTHDFVSLHVGRDPKLNTLEPQIVAVNELETLNRVLGTSFGTKDEIQEAMLADKTRAALSIFESPTKIVMPEYIREAVAIGEPNRG